MTLEMQAILAHAMNGQPLTAEHGFPLRSIVPGYIGARSVKWLTKITLSDRPSPNHYVAEAYKLVQSDAKDEVAAAEPIYDFPINAAICAPPPARRCKAGRTLVSGYALASGDRPGNIDKVELSADGGQNLDHRPTHRHAIAPLPGNTGPPTSIFPPASTSSSSAPPTPSATPCPNKATGISKATSTTAGITLPSRPYSQHARVPYRDRPSRLSDRSF